MRFGGSRPKLAPDPDLIRSLAKLLDETGLSEIEYAVGDQRIHVARHTAAPASAASVAPPVAEKPAAAPAGANGAAHPGANGHDHPGTLKAPLVGIAYLAAEPGQPPYVRVGDTVAEGQTLLIIEAMKVMNQIKAPKGGKLARILISDSSPVEFGQAVMILE